MASEETIAESQADIGPSKELKDYFFNLVLYGQQPLIPGFLKDHPDSVHWVLYGTMTGLMDAVSQGYNGIAELLLKAGARTEDTTENGKTSLGYAASGGNVGGVLLLLKYGADINAPTGNGETPLTEAIDGWHTLAALTLVEQGAGLEPRGWDGQTPLLKAAQRGDAAVCSALLRAGASLEATDNNGRNALEVAKQWRDWNTDNQKWLDVIEMLEPVFADKADRALKAEGSAIADSVLQGTDKPVAVAKPLRLKGVSNRSWLVPGRN